MGGLARRGPRRGAVEPRVQAPPLHGRRCRRRRDPDRSAGHRVPYDAPRSRALDSAKRASGGALKVLDAWVGLASAPFPSSPGFLGPSATRLRPPARCTIGEGAVKFACRLAPTHPVSIDGAIGPHRVWAHSSASLEDVKTIRSTFGGTVNDVVLAAVSGGYRALLIERGDDADRAVVRSLVPVSTRHADGHGVPDNRVSALLCELPVHIGDPVDRLEAMKGEMAKMKSSHVAEAGESVVTAGNLAPPMLLGPVTRVAIRSMHRFGQHSLNTVTTNVPGPQFPLYCLGHEMHEYWPFVPISHGLRIGTAILSFNKNVYFGITGDFTAYRDIRSPGPQPAASGIADLARPGVSRHRRAPSQEALGLIDPTIKVLARSEVGEPYAWQ